MAQLTASQPTATERVATILAPTTWLRSDDTSGRRVVEASFGTRLGVVGMAGHSVRVSVPPNRVLRIAAEDVSVTRGSEPALMANGAAAVRSASMFEGLPYLWAGTSGFGLDCSGLTSLVYRAHGVTIPRDAGPQSRAGRLVDPQSPRAGDLLFFAAAGSVHHVAIYAGAGLMVHAPGTGLAVQRVPVAGYLQELSAARHYLG
jgi:cell wall-associated NlpC family hydrolase